MSLFKDLLQAVFDVQKEITDAEPDVPFEELKDRIHIYVEVETYIQFQREIADIVGNLSPEEKEFRDNEKIDKSRVFVVHRNKHEPFIVFDGARGKQ